MPLLLLLPLSILAPNITPTSFSRILPAPIPTQHEPCSGAQARENRIPYNRACAGAEKRIPGLVRTAMRFVLVMVLVSTGSVVALVGAVGVG